MNQGRQRNLIPHAFSDLNSWIAPDINVLSDKERERYIDRRRAVEMYASGETHSRILELTGKSSNEVRRLVKKCLTANGKGGIFGFSALITAVRTGKYSRTKKVCRQIGDGSAGCAGALGNLFSKFPDIETNIQTLLFKTASQEIIHEARISYLAIHKEFIKLLRRVELTDDDWPFNTANRGYKSLVRYCNQQRILHLDRWIKARVGADASRRSAVGNGYKTLIPVLRPYAQVQLDFHKIDASSIITLETEYGTELSVPLSRWHIGLLVDERSSAVIGACIALEGNPSSDAVLETIESALIGLPVDEQSAAFAFISDQKFLPNQIFSDLLFQCFSSLKMDNAWSNSASEVVNNVMDTVGCAINFGPVRAWWRRPLIERIFGELTRKGLQRLPSTYGSSPTDTKKNDPQGQAVSLKIMLSELTDIVFKCIKQYNETPSEGLQFASPIGVLQTALERQATGFVPQPIPIACQEDLRLLSHVEECTVRGNINKHVRPHVRSDRCRYTNTVLANSYHLVGKKVVLYVNRRDARKVRATIKETGEDIGLLTPERRWSDNAISLRDRKLLNRSGLALRLQDEREDIVSSWGRQKKEELLRLRTKGRKKLKASKRALDVARNSIRYRSSENSDPQVEVAPVPPPSYPDVFGIYEIPDITSGRRR